MPEYVHDPRQRHSYELRPDAAFDAAVRALATGLESQGLIAPGASTAPRFHPHLTLLRAAEAEPALVDQVASAVATAAGFTCTRASTFGEGRIIWLGFDADSALRVARSALLESLDPASVDPVATTRPWTPHVTVAYAVPEPAREQALAWVEQQLPLAGRWARAQCWDLDVRPTVLAASADCVPDAGTPGSSTR